MARLTPKVYCKIKALRRKYADDAARSAALDKLMWWSLPCVYTSFKEDLIDIRKDYHSICESRRKVRKYINGMVATFPRLYLVSLTFSDDYIDCQEDTLKKYASRWLNAECDDYYACVDFGKKSGRIHYHAICAISWDLVEVVNVKAKNQGKYLEPKDFIHQWTYGFSSFRPLSVGDVSDTYKVLNYAFKASSYSFKCADRKKYKPFHKRGVDHWYLPDETLNW